MRLALVLHGTVRWAALSGGGLLALLLLDELLHLPQALRLPLAVVLVGFIARRFLPARLASGAAPALARARRAPAGNRPPHRGQPPHQRAPFPAPGRSTRAGARSSAPILASSSSALEQHPQPLALADRRAEEMVLRRCSPSRSAGRCSSSRFRATSRPAWSASSFRWPTFRRSATGPSMSRPSGRVRVVEGDRLDITARAEIATRPRTASRPCRRSSGRTAPRAADSTLGEHAAMVPTGRAGRIRLQLQRGQPAVPLSRRRGRFAQRLGRGGRRAAAAAQGLDLQRHAAGLHRPASRSRSRAARGARGSRRLDRQGPRRTFAELARRAVAHRTRQTTPLTADG